MEVVRKMKAVVHVASSRRVLHVGDAVRAAAELLGLRLCPGCDRRRRSLNRFQVRW